MRLALTVAALACGVALVGAIDLMNRAVYNAFVEIVDTMAGRAALQVTTGNDGLMPEATIEAVRGVDGVELAVPVVSGSAFTTDGSGEQLAVHGIDITNDDAVRVYEPADATAPTLEDPLVFLNQPDSVMLTEQFADRHRLSLDDRIDLDTPTGRRTFTVRALLAPRGIARVQGGGIVLMDIGAAQVAFGRPGLVNRIDVVLQRDADLARVADAITIALPPGLQVEAPEQRKVDLQRVMRSIQTLLSAVGLFGLAAAFLIAFSRLTNVFEARTWQLAQLRAIGLRRRRVWWEITKESVLVGLAGVAIGIPLAIALGHALLPALATTTAISSKLMTADATLSVRAPSLLLAGGLGLVAAVLAAALPAARAAQVSVAETLRHRGVEQAQGGGRRVGLLRLVVAVVAAGVTLLHLRSGTAASGLLTTCLVVLAAAIAPRAVLERLAGPLARLAPRVAGPAGRLAVASLLRNPRRTALTISTLGVGFGTVLWLWTIARSFEESVVSVMPGVLRGDLAVSSANVGAGYVEAPLGARVLGELARVPGVDGVVGEQAVDWPFKDGPVAINAFDPSYFVDPRFGRWSLVGRSLPGVFEAVARGDAVLVSENFIRNLAANVGDVLTLDSPRGPLSVRVGGVVRDFLSPRGTIEMSRTLYEQWWQDDHIIRALVRTEPGVAPDEVQRRIERTLGTRYGLKILSLQALVQWFQEQVRRAFSALHILASFVLVVVLVGVGDALAASMLERTRELGMARAMGVRRAVLGRVVLLEALVLGVLGFGLAAILGLSLGLLWVKATFPALLGWTLALHMPTMQVVGVGFATLAVCLAAAYLPAARAVRLDPVAALRQE